MRILVVAVGSYGDVLPLVGLALALKQRSYAITFFSNDHFASLVRRCGIEFVALGSSADYDAVASHPDLWNKYKGLKLIGSALVSQALREAYNILRSYAKKGKTMMVSSSLGFAARLLQESHNIPTVTVHLSPGVFHSAFEAPKAPGIGMPRWLPVFVKQGMWIVLNKLLLDPIVKPSLNRFRKELGLKPVSRIFQRWLHSPDLVLCLFPEWFAAKQPDWPPQTRVTSFPLFDDAYHSEIPDDVRTFLEQGSPPLVFTPGSANKFAGHFFEEAAKACQLLRKRAVFLTQYPEQLTFTLPPGVQHFSYAPLSRLLPHCTALIHHGGIGTCSQALRAGIPQLIQPLNFDQFDNGARLERLGVGLTISASSFHASNIAEKIKDLLASPTIKTQCVTVANYFTDVSPLEEPCNIIESTLLARHST